MDFTKDIYINKDIIYEDSEIVILYKGFLFSNNLTDEVYISYGYGSLWENKSEIKMKPSTFGYIATIKIGYGESLEFCFRDSNGIWDNNSGQNYILPLKKAESLFSFKPVVNLAKEVSFEINYTEEKNHNLENLENPNIFETSVISSNQVELYKTVDLENTEKQTIPDDTLVTQVKLDSNNQNVVSNAVIKTPEPDEFVSEVFTKLAEQAKEQSVKAFDEGRVTAGSIYVNSLTSDAPKTVENITDKKSLITSDVSTSEKAIVPVQTLGQTVKLTFTKFVKLIKTALNLGESKD